MTLKFSGFRAVVKEHVHANFIEISAAVNELSCVQRKKSCAENYSPSLPRGQ